MKIFAPINQTTDISKLAAVSDEFYLGVIDQEWEKKYSPFIGYNTRAFSGTRANFASWEKLSEAVSLANKVNRPCYLTVNSHNIGSSQLSLIKRIVTRFAEIGGAGIICSEANTMEMAKDAGLKVFVSTDMSIYNVQALKYIERNYSVDRFILPRDVTLSEIKKIRQCTDAELEVFGQNLGCKFSNGLCYCTHNCNARGMCYTSARSEWNYFSKTKTLLFSDQYDADINHKVYSDYLLLNACSLCVLYDFYSIGIDSIKIVGRELAFEDVYAACKIMSEKIHSMRQFDSREEYWATLKPNNQSISRFSCLWGLQCYYPNDSCKKFQEKKE